MEFGFSFAPWYRRLADPIGMGPKRARVRIDDNVLHVEMGWAFKAAIPLTSITDARHGRHRLVEGFGAHGFRGDWLVNGSSENIVELAIDPPAPARAAMRQIELRNLRVSVSEPDSLIAACTNR